MANYGIKIARRGKDINSNDPNDYTLHSGYNTVKIAEEGTITGSFKTGDGTYEVSDTISHNLGYKPLVRSYARIDESGVWILAPAKHEITTGSDTWTFYTNFTHDNDNQVTFSAGSAPPLGTSAPTANTYNVTIKYYILIDPLKDAWYE